MEIELIINTADIDAVQNLRERVAELRRDGHTVYPHITFEAGDATGFAREAVTRGADLVICAGGDGTLNEVVNGMLPPVGQPLPPELPRLAVVPLGTGNDFAAFLNVPDDLQQAFALTVDGDETLVDVAVLNDRYFLNVSSGGLGAEATEEASDRAKRFLGSAAYVVAGARTFGALEPSQARFVADGDVVFEGPFLLFSLGNGGRSGGGNWLTPRADLTDGMLDLCIVREMSRTELLRLLPELRTGDHLEDEHVIYCRVASLNVEPLGRMTVNVDGELVDEPSLSYSVIPRALRVRHGRTLGPV